MGPRIRGDDSGGWRSRRCLREAIRIRAPSSPPRICARVVLNSSPSTNRGRGEGRALAAPVARLRKRMQAAGTTGLAGHARPSPRDGFNGCFAFSLVHRACWPPCARCAHTHRAGYQHRDIRTARLDRACIAVRPRKTLTLRRRAPIASHCQRFVTVAKRPPCGSRDARKGAADLPDDATRAACDKLARRAKYAWPRCRQPPRQSSVITAFVQAT
ncbi:hypothetical protein ACVIJ6_002028 [Bradyrhizobium sp. USDA 4369]